MRSRYLPRFVPVVLVVLLLAACGDSADEAADTTVAATTSEATTTTAAVTTTVAPTTTTVAVTTTEALPVVEVPGPGEPWDMLVLSSIYDLGEEFLATYEAEAEATLGVDVNAVFAGNPNASAWELLQVLRGDAYPPLDDLARQAEVVLLIAYPDLSYDGEPGEIDDDSANCWYEASTKEPEPPAPTTDEYWAPYTALLDDIYAEIRTLRQNTPTVLIGPDLHNRQIARQRRGNVEAECRQWVEEWNAVVRDAAERNGAVYVPISDVMSGPNRDIDAFEAGYTGATEQYPTISDTQPNEVGTPMVVEAIIAAGLEPTTQP